MTPEPCPIGTFSVVCTFPRGKPREISGLSYQEAVRRAVHERKLWEDDPEVTITIQPDW